MPRNLVLITYDSCRLDSARAAKAPNLARLGEIEGRYSYASWTAPSHYAILMGLVPHLSPTRVYASEVYKEDFAKWSTRLEIPNLNFGSFLPQLSLPAMLKTYGYRTVGRVSMPVLNPRTAINSAFDDYKLMSNHNDFAGMVAEAKFSRTQPPREDDAPRAQPLGPEPLLVSRIQARREGDGRTLLALLPQEGAGTHLMLSDNLLHGLMKLVQQSAVKAEWDLELDLPPVPTFAEEAARERVLN